MQVAMSNAEHFMIPWWESGVVRLGFDESIGTFILLKVFAQVIASCDELSFFLLLMSFKDAGRPIGAGQFLTISANHFIHISSYFLSQLATPSSTTSLPCKYMKII
jgi:hypothetical protein